MSKFWLLAAAILLPATALAADPTEPVKEVMAAVTTNWADEGAEFQDYFSEDLLTRLYSADFIARYRKAAATPFAQEMGSPFDWDVITNGQEGCPLENLTIAIGAAKDGTSDVVARFQNFTCFGLEQEYQVYTEAHFLVVEENGRPVIDDIVTSSDGDTMSLKAEMDAIANDN